MVEESSRNMYKGHMDQAKEGKIEGGRWGWVAEKWRQLYLNDNKKNTITTWMTPTNIGI